MSIRIALNSPDCEPFKAHRWDAGWDLRSTNEDFILEPGDKVEVHTGIKVEIPIRHAGMVFPRSGAGCNFRVGLANTVGIIDSDYRGEIIVWLVNDGDKPKEIKQFDRVCQLLIVPVRIDNLRFVSNVSKTTRGNGGFGHTGEE